MQSIHFLCTCAICRGFFFISLFFFILHTYINIPDIGQENLPHFVTFIDFRFIAQMRPLDPSQSNILHVSVESLKVWYENKGLFKYNLTPFVGTILTFELTLSPPNCYFTFYFYNNDTDITSCLSTLQSQLYVLLHTYWFEICFYTHRLILKSSYLSFT